MTRAGYITFEEDDAFDHLVKYGYVVTFRGDRTVGESWCSRGRGHTKEFDVAISRLTPEPVHILSPLLDRVADDSGFGTADRWRQGIRRQHGVGAEGFLYLVVRADIASPDDELEAMRDIMEALADPGVSEA